MIRAKIIPDCEKNKIPYRSKYYGLFFSDQIFFSRDKINIRRLWRLHPCGSQSIRDSALIVQGLSPLFFLFLFETGSCYISQAGPEILVIRPMSPKYWHQVYITMPGYDSCFSLLMNVWFYDGQPTAQLTLFPDVVCCS